MISNIHSWLSFTFSFIYAVWFSSVLYAGLFCYVLYAIWFRSIYVVWFLYSEWLWNLYNNLYFWDSVLCIKFCVKSGKTASEIGMFVFRSYVCQLRRMSVQVKHSSENVWKLREIIHGNSFRKIRIRITYGVYQKSPTGNLNIHHFETFKGIIPWHFQIYLHFEGAILKKRWELNLDNIWNILFSGEIMKFFRPTLVTFQHYHFYAQKIWREICELVSSKLKKIFLAWQLHDNWFLP